MNSTYSNGAGSPSTLAKALLESEQRFRAIVETSLQGKLVHRGFRPLFANSAMAAMLGYAGPEDILADGLLLDRMDEETRADPDGAWRVLLHGGPVVRRTTWRRRDGARFRVETFSRPISWQGSAAVAVAVMDVTREETADTQRREALAQAEAASRAQQRFLRAAAHELRTPLHGAMGRLQLLMAHALAPDAFKTAAEALRGCQRLQEHIDDLIDNAALEAGMISFADEAFELAALVGSAIEGAEDSAGNADLPVQFIAPELAQARVLGDPRRVRRIVASLVEEALRRRPKKPIEVRVETERLGVSFSVRAPGGSVAAILRGDWDRPVEPLALTRNLAAAMGGIVTEHVGSSGWEGAAFLPLTLAAPAAAPKPGPQAPCDILVVEDNSGNRALIKLILETLGHRPTLAPDGASAVAAAAHQRFDMILMDLAMPDMDGFETTRAIRLLPAPYGTCPIVALTASAAPGVEADAAEAGMDAFLHKPLDIPRLMETIAMLTAPSVNAAELNEIEQQDYNDEAENDAKRGHG